MSFTDIGPADSPGLAVPNDLVTNFFNVDYDNGARLHSNSWGANTNAYTVPTADVDEFMAKFDDMLILYAAGNSRQDGPGSVGAPATCRTSPSARAKQRADRGDARTATLRSSRRRAPPARVRVPARAGHRRARILGAVVQLELARRLPHHLDGRNLDGHPVATATPRSSVNTSGGLLPTGTKGGSGQKLLSGAAMKALMINSATSSPEPTKAPSSPPTCPTTSRATAASAQ